MARTTDELVRGVCNLSAGVDTTPFIDDANLLVDAHCTNSGYTEGHLTRIETWLAAHLALCAKKLNQQSVQLGMGVGESYAVRVDLGLKQTVQGQQAMRFDWAGNLAAIDNALNKVQADLPADPAGGVRRMIHWLGTDPDEE